MSVVGEPVTDEQPLGPAVPGLPVAAGGVWDLLVIGGGTAGIVGAKTAASLGVSVLLVERHRIGGDCLWTGCVPSKALLSAAARAAAARTSAGYGVRVSGVEVDFAAVMAQVRSAVQAIEPADSVPALQEAGAQAVIAEARLTGPDTALVAGRPVRFRQALLATGAAPAVPPIPGLAEAVAGGEALTSDTVWDLPELPARLVVLGGGSIGCELGQAFARLGSRVTVIEAAPRLLPREDPEASALVTAALQADGVDVRTGAAVGEITDGRVLLDGGVQVGYDRLLVAVGRSPRTRDLGLDVAGIRLAERGFVQVDAALRTTNRRVWAAGDLTGHPQFTHTAGVHASLAASNAVLGLHRRAETRVVPRVTFTHPEVAGVGISPEEAAGAPGLRVVTRAHTQVDRAIAEAETGGYTSLVVDGKSRIVGAVIVGPRAGESLAELVLAIRAGMTTRELAGAMHAYPTFADGPWNAAIDDVKAQLATPRQARPLRALAAARRRWLTLRG